MECTSPKGARGVLTDQDARDYYDLIEWAGSQPWSTGAVGLLGVSYLAMRRGRNPRFAFAEDFPKERDARPLDDFWWAEKRPRLEAITLPALVCVNWSDHGLHTRGSLEGFERIGSTEKWLFTHGRKKWETFYSAEARSLQLCFFDYYLKRASNGWSHTPRVRLEVRKSRNDYSVRSEDQWPIPTVNYRPLYLDAKTGWISLHPSQEECSTRYRPKARVRKNRVSFMYSFESSTELTGSMTLKLWISISEGDDLDLFVVLRKFDPKGKEVYFYGYNGYAKDGAAKGWLRASHRELDPYLTRPGRPWHTHRTIERVKPGRDYSAGG